MILPIGKQREAEAMARRDYYSVDLREPNVVCARCGSLVVSKYRAKHSKDHERVDELIRLTTELSEMINADQPIPF